MHSFDIGGGFVPLRRRAAAVLGAAAWALAGISGISVFAWAYKAKSGLSAAFRAVNGKITRRVLKGFSYDGAKIGAAKTQGQRFFCAL